MFKIEKRKKFELEVIGSVSLSKKRNGGEQDLPYHLQYTISYLLLRYYILPL